MRAAHLPDDLWRSLIDDLDAGVLILDAERVIVFANAAAANLLDYPPHDVLGLDGEDFLALCQPDRLDINHLRADLVGNKSPAGQVYTVTTARRRLSAQIIPLAVGEGSGIVLILRPLSHWRADLIAQRTLNEMHGPLTLASDYAETLLQRLEDEQPENGNLRDLARVSHASLRQALDVWEALRRLNMTGAWALPTSAFGPIQLEGAMLNARDELAAQVGTEFPVLQFDLPDWLPQISGAPQLLHVGLCALLDGAAARLKKRDNLVVSADNKQSYVQVAVTAGTPDSALRPYLFDELPFAIAEQAVIQHGGRIWFDNHSTIPTCCFTLPVWLVDP